MSNLTHKSKGLCSWLRSLIFIYALGVVASFYSLMHHYEIKEKGATDAFCNISSQLNCDKVASSSYSEFFSIPMGGWGLAYFFAMLFILWFVSKRKTRSMGVNIFIFCQYWYSFFFNFSVNIFFYIKCYLCYLSFSVFLCVFSNNSNYKYEGKNIEAIKKVVFNSFLLHLLLPTAVVLIVLSLNLFFNKSKTLTNIEKNLILN